MSDLKAYLWRLVSFLLGFIWPFGIVRVFVFDRLASERVREIYIRFQKKELLQRNLAASCDGRAFAI